MQYIYFLTVAASCFITSSAFAAQSTTSLELKYFNIKGVAETSRILFAIAEQDYKDTRYEITPGTFDAPEFKAAKEAGDLKMNMNRAPVLVVGENNVIGQSKTIERFLAKKFGMMGSNDIEEAQVDCITEHCRDVKDAMTRKGFSVFARNKTDEEKAALRKEWYEDDMPPMLEKMEEAVKESGKGSFAVGEKLSYADVAIFVLLKECSESDVEDTAKAAEKCAMLNAIADAVGTNPQVAKWIQDRPETMF